MAIVTSKWADAVTALLAAVRADSTFTSIDVFDGPVPNASALTGTWLTVGWDSAGSPAVDWTEYDYGSSTTQSPRDERFSISCAMQVLSGESDFSGVRTSVNSMLQAVDRLLRTSPNDSLSGAVLYCRVVPGRALQEQTQRGARVTVDFTVECRAYLTTN